MQFTLRRSLIVALTTFLSACNQCDVPAASTSTPGENVEALLLKMEQDWLDAMLKKDTAATDVILADDFIQTLPDGLVLTKAQHLESLASGKFTVESIAIDNGKVRVIGDTAIVTLHQTEKASSMARTRAARRCGTMCLCAAMVAGKSWRSMEVNWSKRRNRIDRNVPSNFRWKQVLATDRSWTAHLTSTIRSG